MNVAKEDRWLDAPRPVRLYPAELAECVTVELFTEILDHVIALGLTVNEDVQAKRFLFLDTTGDLAAHGGIVGILADLAGL